eukprot:CAMPEP_0115048046 /NCGR_PEP_ID=MMETSP0227-20121206/329_1 /TAXON_ID=89957 /ORGANISM="Polarella glacialis, Strain CCMP 1383" /LENGTH=246 /DNA_ID=CAMNT_0002431383 /DNA_START=32 /DNA_END=772 /DNA_ORIENTATION=+
MGQTSSCGQSWCAVNQSSSSEILPQVLQQLEVSPLKASSRGKGHLPTLLGSKEDVEGCHKEPLAPLEAVVEEQAEASGRQVPNLAPEAEATERVAGHARSKSRSRSLFAKSQKKILRTQARTEVRPFLQSHGFQTVKSRKSFLWRFSYPLHAAVKVNNLHALQLLLTAGADPTKANSAGLTPQLLAGRLDKNGSHAEVLAALDALKWRRSGRAAAVGSASRRLTPVARKDAASSSGVRPGDPGVQA